MKVMVCCWKSATAGRCCRRSDRSRTTSRGGWARAPTATWSPAPARALPDGREGPAWSAKAPFADAHQQVRDVGVLDVLVHDVPGADHHPAQFEGERLERVPCASRECEAAAARLDDDVARRSARVCVSTFSQPVSTTTHTSTLKPVFIGRSLWKGPLVAHSSG